MFLFGLHAQGPVALVTIDEVSLGRSKSPIKLANKLATQHDGLRFRLPFTVRGVKIVLRRSKLPASSEDVPGAQQDGAALASGHQQQHAKSESIKFGAAVINSALRLLLGILPSIPVRVKQLSIVHEVGQSNMGAQFHQHPTCCIGLLEAACVCLRPALRWVSRPGSWY